MLSLYLDLPQDYINFSNIRKEFLSTHHLTKHACETDLEIQCPVGLQKQGQLEDMNSKNHELSGNKLKRV